jgi:putative tail protein
MGFWITALFWVGSLVIGRIFQPRAPKPTEAKPEKFEGITSEEGRAIPVVWGTRQLKNSNIGWFGDLYSQAIVDGGSTVGYKYYMSAMHMLCMGRIDDVVAIHFNEKPVGVGIDSSNDGIVFSKSGSAPWATAHIENGSYPDGGALAQAIEAAMEDAEPGDWQLAFGFQVVPGVNDRLVIQVGANTSTVVLRPGKYDGNGLATEVADRLNATIGPGLVWTSVYDLPVFGPAFKFQIGRTDSTSWTLKKESTCLTLLGFKHHLDLFMPGPGSVVGDHQVKANRFLFQYGGDNARLRCTDVGFTSAATLGISTAADKTGIGGAMSDSDFSVITATYTDGGFGITVAVNDLAFFGNEGGVEGSFFILKGGDDQPGSTYLAAQWGVANAPAFLGLCYAIQRRLGPPNGMYVGNTNVPKPVAFTVRRCPNQLGLLNEHHNIGGDANPACMIYEILTDTSWGLGLPASQIHVASFQAAGETLFNEGFGLSMILDATTPASDVVQEILRHIDGVLYLDHLTGLIAVRLARADYIVADLPLITADENTYDMQMKHRSWDETRNVIRIRYVDRSKNFTERVHQVQELANLTNRDGDLSVEDIPMPGISSERNAAIAAQRALKVLSGLPRQFTFRVNRQAWSLRPGSPFRLTWPDWGITDMPCRVSTIGLGSPGNSEIRVNAVEDVIGPAWVGFATPLARPDDPPELEDLPPPSEQSGETIFGGMPFPVD